MHRRRRESRPFPGMPLHIDGSHYQCFQNERWYNLIAILDDATGEIDHAMLVKKANRRGQGVPESACPSATRPVGALR